MGAIELYEKEFVERTRHILKRYRGKYKLSNAINCTLGLIILPNEMIRRLSLRELQSATGEELSALLPSVLDRAFKGEL
jgi:hypothetical protein